jgi:hypothetical protein
MLSYMTTRLDKQVTGNVGLYYCCYQLSLRGWNVMPTARNAKGVDIVIYNSDATKYLGIQVKTLSGKHDVPLGSALNIMGDYWVILTEVATGKPTVFVLQPKEVRAGSVENQRDGKSSFWLSRKHYSQTQFLEAWEQIGFGHPVSETPFGS